MNSKFEISDLKLGEFGFSQGHMLAREVCDGCACPVRGRAVWYWCPPGAAAVKCFCRVCAADGVKASAVLMEVSL